MKLSKYKKQIFDKVLNCDKKILLPEINDERIVQASKKMQKMGFCVLNLSDFNFDLSFYKECLSNKKFINNWTEEMLDFFLSNSFNRSLLLLNEGKVDCVVGGATMSTANVIRSSIRIVGVKDQWVSSIFLMISNKEDYAYTYSDCGVIPEPNEKQLVSIAYNAALYHRKLTGEEPKLAFLSFSTKGSAEHYKIDRINNALEIFSKKHPDIVHDGELQFDAAIDMKVAKMKKADSILKGQANVFIFPDLYSANISYKITQYLAGFEALGPLLTGLKKPVHDLSRGASVDDIISISSIAALDSI
ncbi:MAG: phosphate acetyltransferase [Candidatus Marinimicrobia bacterium]|nr:phosphate acetyltransferase [Candidatus Neomarinimicrobiota bacterium]|tara:strand:+ start:16022 stop:16930 length:909 start_codon:yes stop_codon:yes gene_type:complete